MTEQPPDRLRRMEFASPAEIDAEFEGITDIYRQRPPRRWPLPIRTARRFFSWLNYMRKQL